MFFGGAVRVDSLNMLFSTDETIRRYWGNVTWTKTHTHTHTVSVWNTRLCEVLSQLFVYCIKKLKKTRHAQVYLSCWIKWQTLHVHHGTNNDTVLMCVGVQKCVFVACWSDTDEACHGSCLPLLHGTPITHAYAHMNTVTHTIRITSWGEVWLAPIFYTK